MVVALAKPNSTAAMVLMTSPIKVSMFGEICVSASHRRCFAGDATAPSEGTGPSHCTLHYRKERPSWPGSQRRTSFRLFLNFFWSSSSWMVVSFSTSSSRLPLGVTTTAMSPTFFSTSARPMGELVEISPLQHRTLHWSPACTRSALPWWNQTTTVEPEARLVSGDIMPC